jgi:hypothetical protein
MRQFRNCYRPVIILIMPFTLSHAAAALPFRRTRLVMSAVVVGCFAPDFEYFSPLGHHGSFGHTLTGMFVLDLPLGLAVLWLFHRYVREPLTACLPEGARERLDRTPDTFAMNSFSRFAMIAFSILVGIATHLFWDAFTHPRYWLYDHWLFLRQTVSIPLFGPRPWFGILQYLSSVLGIVVVLLWYLHWYRTTPPVHSKRNRPFLTSDRIVIACSLVLAIASGFVHAVASGVPHGVPGSQRFIANAVITGITVLWVEIVIYGIVRALRRNTVKPV